MQNLYHFLSNIGPRQPSAIFKKNHLAATLREVPPHMQVTKCLTLSNQNSHLDTNKRAHWTTGHDFYLQVELEMIYAGLLLFSFEHALVTLATLNF